ncbi:hypothetical protein [Lichenibacterium dinghuense]|uniref:hypothetical protein n=1 Tax=Lichenibacterium dinghuense TaxID=2895977 RepID=UPI001F41BC29|nr:hypothetical protein [Lichenibacterium sp. 6Y81]
MYNELPNVAFVFRWEWAVVVLLYGLLGALVAAIYPYRGTPTMWLALLLGCSFPTVLGAAASLMKAGGPGASLGAGNAAMHWDLLGFLSLF